MLSRPIVRSAALASALFLADGAAAATPTGVWMDPDGRGAVDITECGANLCGHLVWLRDARDAGLCGTQILGDLTPTGRGQWRGGWVYDPDDKKRYNVDMKPAGDDKLRVTGYVVSRLFSETVELRRPTAELPRCDIGATTVASAPVVPPTPAAAVVPLPPPLPVASAGSVIAAPMPAVAPPAPPPEATPAAAPTASPAPAGAAIPMVGEPQVMTRRAALVAGAAGPPPAKPKPRGSRRPCTVTIPYLDITVPCPD